MEVGSLFSVEARPSLLLAPPGKIPNPIFRRRFRGTVRWLPDALLALLARVCMVCTCRSVEVLWHTAQSCLCNDEPCAVSSTCLEQCSLARSLPPIHAIGCRVPCARRRRRCDGQPKRAQVLPISRPLWTPTAAAATCAVCAAPRQLQCCCWSALQYRLTASPLNPPPSAQRLPARRAPQISLNHQCYQPLSTLQRAQ